MKARISLLVVAGGAMTGCATIATLAFPGRIQEEMYNEPQQLQSLPRVYSGTIADGYCLSQFASPTLLCLVDLPFSAVADTVVLPYTVARQLQSGNLRPRCGERVRDAVAKRREEEFRNARESCARAIADPTTPAGKETACRRLLSAPGSPPAPRSEKEACGEVSFDPFEAR